MRIMWFTSDGGHEELMATEMLVGDVITHCKTPSGGWEPVASLYGNCVGWRVTRIDERLVWGTTMLDDDGESSVDKLIYLNNPYTWRVRLHADVAAPEPEPDRWNGKCPTCSRGTYTGFSTFEHDGPCRS